MVDVLFYSSETLSIINFEKNRSYKHARAIEAGMAEYAGTILKRIK